MRVEHLFISPGHNYFGHYGRPAGEHPTLPVASIDCVEGRGIINDRFFDYKPDYKGQITFLSAEVFEELVRHFDLPKETNPGLMRRNVVLRGVDLNRWIGKRFEIQGVEFLGTVEAKPCFWMNQALCEGAEEWLMGRGGLRAKITRSGSLQVDPS